MLFQVERTDSQIYSLGDHIWSFNYRDGLLRMQGSGMFNYKYKQHLKGKLQDCPTGGSLPVPGGQW